MNEQQRKAENAMAMEAYGAMITALAEGDLAKLEAANRVMGTVQCDPAFKQAYVLEMQMRAQLIEAREIRTPDTLP